MLYLYIGTAVCLFILYGGLFYFICMNRMQQGQRLKRPSLIVMAWILLWLLVRIVKYCLSDSLYLSALYVDCILYSFVILFGILYQMTIIRVFSVMVTFLTDKLIFRLQATGIVLFLAYNVVNAFPDYLLHTDQRPTWYIYYNLIAICLYCGYALGYELMHGFVAFYCLRKLAIQKVKNNQCPSSVFDSSVHSSGIDFQQDKLDKSIVKKGTVDKLQSLSVHDQETLNSQLTKIAHLQIVYVGLTLGDLTALLFFVWSRLVKKWIEQVYELGTFWVAFHVFAAIVVNAMLRYIQFPVHRTVKESSETTELEHHAQAPPPTLVHIKTTESRKLI